MTYRNKNNKVFVVLLTVILFFSSCSDNQIPKEFKKAISNLFIELDKIKKIPTEEKIIVSTDKTFESIIDIGNQVKYYKENKIKIERTFIELERIQGKLRNTKYQDDILFCLSIGYLQLAFLDESKKTGESALRCASSFIELGEDTKIESWTKKKMRNTIWDNLSIGFAVDISEKNNLNQFFFISKASIWQHQRQNVKKTLENYQKALQINPDNLWGKQAKMYIDLLSNG